LFWFNVCSWPILLKKSVFANELILSGALTRVIDIVWHRHHGRRRQTVELHDQCELAAFGAGCGQLARIMQRGLADVAQIIDLA